MRKRSTTSLLIGAAAVAMVGGTDFAAASGPLDTGPSPLDAMDEQVPIRTSVFPPTRASASRDAATTSVPAAPTGLEARVYSTTAGEIFWARPATFGLVYDVRRDGETLARCTDGRARKPRPRPRR